MSDYRLLDFPSFMTFHDAQHAASVVEPAGDPARWAVVNAIIALAVRAKMAPGSETELSDIPQALYQNALTVTPELIYINSPSLLSVTALLAMAMFARGIPGTQAFVMLITNASRQLELLRLSGFFAGQAIDIEESYRRLHKIASTFEETLGMERFVRPIL